MWSWPQCVICAALHVTANTQLLSKRQSTHGTDRASFLAESEVLLSRPANTITSKQESVPLPNVTPQPTSLGITKLFKGHSHTIHKG